jgi:hypothetical protein
MSLPEPELEELLGGEELPAGAKGLEDGLLRLVFRIRKFHRQGGDGDAMGTAKTKAGMKAGTGRNSGKKR